MSVTADYWCLYVNLYTSDAEHSPERFRDRSDRTRGKRYPKGRDIGEEGLDKEDAAKDPAERFRDRSDRTRGKRSSRGRDYILPEDMDIPDHADMREEMEKRHREREARHGHRDISERHKELIEHRQKVRGWRCLVSSVAALS